MSATGRGAPAQLATADREIVISRVISPNSRAGEIDPSYS